MGHDDDGRSLTLEIINNERLKAFCHVLHTHPSLAGHKGSGFRVSGFGFGIYPSLVSDQELSKDNLPKTTCQSAQLLNGL